MEIKESDGFLEKQKSLLNRFSPVVGVGGIYD